MSGPVITLANVAVIVGGVLVVAARFHRRTFRPFAKTPEQERLMYWWSSGTGAVLATAAMLVFSAPAALAVGFVTLWSTFLYGPNGPFKKRRWDRRIDD